LEGREGDKEEEMRILGIEEENRTEEEEEKKRNRRREEYSIRYV
jgi:hypothetical protein